MFDQYLKSKKYIVISIVLVVSLVFVAVLTIKINENNKIKQWLPLTQEINLEYGDSKRITEQYFVRKNDIVEVVSIDLEIPLVESKTEGQSFYALGTYKGVLTVKAGRQELEYDFIVSVHDTIAPRIIKFSERVTVPVGYDGNFTEFFAFEDVDKIQVNIDTHTINTLQVGHYKSKVEAIDESKNITKRDFFVEVVDNGNYVPVPPVIEEPDKPDDGEKEVVKTHSDITISEDINFNIKRIADSNLEEGQERLGQDGVIGKKQIVTRIYYENNVEVRREIIKETTVKAPIDKIVYYGTKPKEEEIVSGAFGDTPKGLVEYETYQVDAQMYARELYEALEDSISRAEELINKGVIERYDQGSTTRNGVRYFYITFKINK